MSHIALLDTKTFFFLYFFCNLFICILIFSYWFSHAVNHNRDMLKQFGWGKLLLSVGWLLIYIRSDLSDLLSINCANSLVLVSCYFESAAILSLIRKNPEKCYRAQFIITATAVFIFNITAFCAESINARILCMNVSVFMIYIIPVVNFFRERDLIRTATFTDLNKT